MCQVFLSFSSVYDDHQKMAWKMRPRPSAATTHLHTRLRMAAQRIYFRSNIARMASKRLRADSTETAEF
jgi:hypothetical protein